MDHTVHSIGTDCQALLDFDEENKESLKQMEDAIKTKPKAFSREAIEGKDRKEESSHTNSFPADSEESTSEVERAMKVLKVLQPSSSTRRRGPKVKPSTKIMVKFHYTGKPSSQLKKDYLREKVIRGFKRGIRQACEGKLPNASDLNGFQPSDESSMEKWQTFCAFVRQRPMLNIIAQTEKGPKTDGKAFKKDSEEAEYDSFNSQFCKEFFRDPDTRASFDLYIRLLFHNEEENVLTAKFECQARSPIKAEREVAWRQLKSFLCVDVFCELGLG